MQSALSENLERWRKSLPLSMQFKDTDPPHPDINTARMRAQYYGARHIIHRPLLFQALHYGKANAHAVPIGHTSPESSTSRSSGSGTPPTIGLRDLPFELRQGLSICIESAVLSTTAFNSVSGRLVVTNIFGTAHALVQHRVFS